MSADHKNAGRDWLLFAFWGIGGWLSSCLLFPILGTVLLCLCGYTLEEVKKFAVEISLISPILAAGVCWSGYRMFGGTENLSRFTGLIRQKGIWRCQLLLLPFAVFAGSCVISLLWQILLGLFGIVPGIPPATDLGMELFRNKEWLTIVFFVLLVLLVAPFCEEFFYRRILGDAIAQCLWPKAAPILQALIFAAVHLSLSAFPALFFLGIMLFWCYRRYQTLWAAVYVHFLYNLCGLATLWVAGSEVP